VGVFSPLVKGQWGVAFGALIHLHGQRLGVALGGICFWGRDMEVEALRAFPPVFLEDGCDINAPSKESASCTRISTDEPSEVLNIPRYDISPILDPGDPERYLCALF